MNGHLSKTAYLVSRLPPAERNHSAIATFGRMNRRPTRMWGISPRRSALRVDLSLKPISEANAATEGYVLWLPLRAGSVWVATASIASSCPFRRPQRCPPRGRSAVWRDVFSGICPLVDYIRQKKQKCPARSCEGSPRSACTFAIDAEEFFDAGTDRSGPE